MNCICLNVYFFRTKKTVCAGWSDTLLSSVWADPEVRGAGGTSVHGDRQAGAHLQVRKPLKRENFLHFIIIYLLICYLLRTSHTFFYLELPHIQVNMFCNKSEVYLCCYGQLILPSFSSSLSVKVGWLKKIVYLKKNI